MPRIETWETIYWYCIIQAFNLNTLKVIIFYWFAHTSSRLCALQIHRVLLVVEIQLCTKDYSVRFVWFSWYIPSLWPGLLLFHTMFMSYICYRLQQMTNTQAHLPPLSPTGTKSHPSSSGGIAAGEVLHRSPLDQHYHQAEPRLASLEWSDASSSSSSSSGGSGSRSSFPGSWVQVERFVVPRYVAVGSNVSLECDYVVQRHATLYSLKWYKGSSQFYQYIPSKTLQPHAVFSVPGLHLAQLVGHFISLASSWAAYSLHIIAAFCRNFFLMRLKCSYFFQYNEIQD